MIRLGLRPLVAGALPEAPAHRLAHLALQLTTQEEQLRLLLEREAPRTPPGAGARDQCQNESEQDG